MEPWEELVTVVGVVWRGIVEELVVEDNDGVVTLEILEELDSGEVVEDGGGGGEEEEGGDGGEEEVEVS